MKWDRRKYNRTPQTKTDLMGQFKLFLKKKLE